MPIKSDAFKSPPLLSPPSDDIKIPELTPEDIQSMEKHRISCRKSPIVFLSGSSLAEMTYFMNELGYPRKLTSDDRGLIKKGIKIMVKNDGFQLSRFYFFMKKLGLEEKITTEDEDFLRLDLKIQSNLSRGRELAGLHYFMRCNGLETDLSDKDKKLITNSLTEYRTKKNGMQLAQTVFYMKELAIPMEITESDQKIIHESILQAKGETMWNSHYAELQFLASKIWPPTEKHTPPLPPIKEV